jgi:hypothetical protein
VDDAKPARASSTILMTTHSKNKFSMRSAVDDAEALNLQLTRQALAEKRSIFETFFLFRFVWTNFLTFLYILISVYFSVIAVHSQSTCTKSTNRVFFHTVKGLFRLVPGKYDKMR